MQERILYLPLILWIRETRAQELRPIRIVVAKKDIVDNGFKVVNKNHWKDPLV